jgi:hypothetical protein
MSIILNVLIIVCCLTFIRYFIRDPIKVIFLIILFIFGSRILLSLIQLIGQILTDLLNFLF